MGSIQIGARGEILFYFILFFKIFSKYFGVCFRMYTKKIKKFLFVLFCFVFWLPQCENSHPPKDEKEKKT